MRRWRRNRLIGCARPRCPRDLDTQDLNRPPPRHRRCRDHRLRSARCRLSGRRVPPRRRQPWRNCARPLLPSMVALWGIPQPIRCSSRAIRRAGCCWWVRRRTPMRIGTGSPFAGPVGAYLEQMLRSVGLGRDAICLAPLLPWRPPGDRPPSPAEIATCLPFLYRIIQIMMPRRIVTLGPLPTRALLGATPIRRRTSPGWQSAAIPGCAVAIPTLTMPSPAILLRVPGQRRAAWADLRWLRHSLDTDLTQT